MLSFISDCDKNQRMCSKAVDNYFHALKVVPDCYKTQEMCKNTVGYLFVQIQEHIIDVTKKSYLFRFHSLIFLLQEQVNFDDKSLNGSREQYVWPQASYTNKGRKN